MNDFEKLVLEIRTAQKNYFKTPYTDRVLKQKYLTESKLKESMVDKHLKSKTSPTLL